MREISSRSCLTVLPGPAWPLLNKICTPFSRSLCMSHGHSLSFFINQHVNLSLLDLLCRGRRLQSCSEIKLPSRRLSTRLITHSPPSHRTTRRTLVAMTVGCLDKVQGDCSDSSRIFILEKVTKKPDGHRPSFLLPSVLSFPLVGCDAPSVLLHST